MKTTIALCFLLSCTACGRQPKYIFCSANDLPVGHIIQRSDLMTTFNGVHWTRAYLPNPNHTGDASRIVGHAVKQHIPQWRAIDLRDIY